MPGLRLYTTVDLGDAFGDDWRRAYGPKRRREERRRQEDATGSSVPYGGWTAVNSRSTVNLTGGGGGSDGEDPFRDPGVGGEDDEDDGGASDGTEYLTRAERRAYRIIQAMRKDPEWNGTRYRLLEKCVSHSQ